jgi:luciferase-type oxidoreductase
MVPQGTGKSAVFETVPLDDPFLWLGLLAGATRRIAIGTAAAVLPLRHPLHLAKSALSLNRLSGDRFLLGLGSGDREPELAAFQQALDTLPETYRDYWKTVRVALSPEPADRIALREITGGFDLMAAPTTRIPMLAVGSARQSLQWIAANADGWATYHREEGRQKGRIGLWQMALRERAGGEPKPFVQSLSLDLLEDPHAPAEAIELGIRAGRHALLDYLLRIEQLQVNHVLLHLARGGRPAAEVVEEIGVEILPRLRVGT